MTRKAWPQQACRGYDAFAGLVAASADPVVLLEGSREVAAEVQAAMQRLAAHLLKTFPSLIARSGNAEGSDQAWARGVNTVDPQRLQLILPLPGYRRAAWIHGNETQSLNDAPAHAVSAARALTRDHYVSGHRAGAAAYDRLPSYKQAYLDRDALKVLGIPDYLGRARKATAALFYLNPAKPGGGGTGHTVRLCHARHVPFFLSDDWLAWPGAL